jgi:hypothetical protein
MVLQYNKIVVVGTEAERDLGQKREVLANHLD